MPGPPQQVYGERYEPLRLIARGGMAEVWQARDALLDRMVALKVLFPELSIDRNFVERFRREAQSAANLSHPNIVSVYDWGEADGTYFIVMEYVDGRPLSAVLREEGPLLADRAASIGADVASALGFAHRNGVIHRDVKPGNVLITTDDHVKVTDFGIARAIGVDDHLTQTGAVMGTATYFSPEQAQGNNVDQRSDVYSLGVVLYEMVTGRPPFIADGPVAVAYKHVHEDVVAPSELVPELPVGFEAIVLQAMAKDPVRRYASAEEVRADLLRFRQGRPVLAEVPPPIAPVPGRHFAATAPPQVTPPAPAAPLRPAPTGPVTVVSMPPAAPQHRVATWMLGALLAILLVALGVVLWLLTRQLNIFGTTISTTSPTTTAAAAVAIPADLVGKVYADAVKELAGLGLTNVTRSDVSDATRDPETVIAVDPAAGQHVSANAAITLTVASGPPAITEPNVVGETVPTATAQLTAAGFKLGQTVTQDSTTVTAGLVISQNPPFGTQGHTGDTVVLTVSDGKGQAIVPDETGKDQATAEADLASAGLVGRVGSSRSSPTVPQGSVVATEPAAGTALPKGSTVTLVVSSGPAKVYVPYLRGYSLNAAEQMLTARGLVAAVTYQTVTSSAEDGLVIDQSPGGGTVEPQGSTVDLDVGQYAAPTTTPLGLIP